MMDDTSSTSRRLAAILAADIAGYSRLMGEDEAATVRDLKAHQAAVLPLVGRYVTSMEMTGMSLSIIKLDDELEMLLKQPCDCPFWRVGA